MWFYEKNVIMIKFEASLFCYIKLKGVFWSVTQNLIKCFRKMKAFYFFWKCNKFLLTFLSVNIYLIPYVIWNFFYYTPWKLKTTWTFSYRYEWCLVWKRWYAILPLRQASVTGGTIIYSFSEQFDWKTGGLFIKAV